MKYIILLSFSLTTFNATANTFGCASDSPVNELNSRAETYIAESDFANAVNCLRHASGQNDGEAMFKLAQLYNNGLPGVLEENSTEAAFWYSAAEKHGSQVARVYASMMVGPPYCKNTHTINKLWEEANYFYNKNKNYETYTCLRYAAAQNDAKAQYYIGTFFRNGLNGAVAQDLAEAQYWFNWAEYNGSLEAKLHNQKQREALSALLDNLSKE